MDISLFGKNIFKHSSRDKGLVWCFWIDWVLYLDWRASFSKFNPFFGLDKELNRSFSLLLEYNAALNDGNEYSTEEDFEEGLTIGKGKGFLNAGLRWTIAENLLIEVNFKDINLDRDDYVNREVKIMYSEKFW